MFRRAFAGLLIGATLWFPAAQQGMARTAPARESFDAAELDRLGKDGNEAIYNLDYRTARDRFTKMTKIAPEHPAGYVYLANNLWLETLYAGRRLATSIYLNTSFYAQDKDSDRVDPDRDREFHRLIKQAITASNIRIQKDPSDASALYYQAAALGLRAAYGASVARSFTRAIGDANDSIQIYKRVLKLDPNYVDSYLSIGLYEYVIDSLPFGWKLLARVAGLKGSKKKGIEHLEMVVNKGKNVSDDARVILASILTREGEHERALGLMTQLASKYPKNFVLGIERAVLLSRMGRRDESNSAFTNLLALEDVARSNTDIVNYQWADALFAAGQYQAALERYSAVKQWQKSEAGLVSLSQLNSGKALDALGKRTGAVSAYEVVLKRENIYDSHERAREYLKKPYSPGP